jgi:hypothetical protein
MAGGAPVTDLAFTDNLPAAVTIANPANASTSCSNGILSAPDGSGMITFSDGDLGGNSICFVFVDVTSGTLGAHINPAIDLTFDKLGGDPPSSLPDDLTAVTNLPGFSKSFAPSSVALDDRSTLTFTVDNTANASRVGSLEFVDMLPS